MPVGGGGLIGGIRQSVACAKAATKVFGAEPALGNDVARSLREGRNTVNSTSLRLSPTAPAPSASDSTTGESYENMLQASSKSRKNRFERESGCFTVWQI